MKLFSDKKAQLTVFIVIGILVLLGLVVFAITNSVIKKQDLFKQVDFTDVQILIQNCFEDRLYNATVLLAGQGGIIGSNNLSYILDDVPVYYGAFNSQIILPNRSVMEQELTDIMRASVSDCFTPSIISNYRNYSLANTTEVSVSINDFSVIGTLKFNSVIYQGSSQYVVPELRLEILVPLGYLHSVAYETINYTIHNDGFIDVTYLNGLPIDFFMQPLSTSDQMFHFSAMGEEHNELFLFRTTVNAIPNSPPVIEIKDVYIFLDDQEVFLPIIVNDSDDTNFTYYSDSGLFNVNSEGVIETIASIPGSYNITLEVADAHNNRVSKKIMITVLEDR